MQPIHDMRADKYTVDEGSQNVIKTVSIKGTISEITRLNSILITSPVQ